MRYEQDIPLPELTANYQALLVTKQTIQRANCSSCGKASSGKDLGGQQVTLGPNVRLLICHLVSVTGLSYAQAKQLLLSLYGLAVSDGEIANTLKDKQIQWTPAYQQLQDTIRSSNSLHVDETSWPIQELQGYGYAWVLSVKVPFHATPCLN